MGFTEYITNRYNLYIWGVPILFILGCIFLKLGFIIGFMYGVLILVLYDKCMGSKNGKKKEN